jgi:[ribosomal protein S5]-alanine N-acetyltransferase
MWNDPAVTRYLPMRGQVDDQRAQTAIQHFNDHWRERGYGVWAVEPAGSAQMIGYGGLRYLDDFQDVEVLYGLRPSAWGYGYATELAVEAVRFAFEEIGLARVIGFVMPQNIASQRVLEKAGLILEGPVEAFGITCLKLALTRSRK